MILLSAPRTAGTLAAVGHRIHDLFVSLSANDLTLQTDKMFQADLLNELQRFDLWARNLGLYEDGHSSLDYRFRDASSAYDFTHQLLDKLEVSLLMVKEEIGYIDSALGSNKSSSPVKRAEPNEDKSILLEALGDPEQSQASDDSSDEEESLLSYQKDSNSNIVLENARLIIDTLYKLSFKIRNPKTRLGFSKARVYKQVDKDTGVDLMDAYLPFDIRHIAETFGRYLQKSPEDCENHFLVQRLGRANTHRRRQFAQWQKHVIKLEKSDRAPVQLSLAKPDLQPVLVPSNEKALSSLPSTATKFEESKINLADWSSSRSTSTIMIPSKDDEQQEDLHIPPLPKSLCDRNEFVCPYCHIICAKRTSSQAKWERHVLRDLRPYVCTYEDCKEADQQYDHIEDWVNHENSHHRQPQRRIHTSSENVLDTHSLGQQLRQSLPDNLDSTTLSLNYVWCTKCPICAKSEPTLHHAALHLRKFAVFALPNIVAPDESITSASLGSNNANVDDQSFMSDTSNYEKDNKADTGMDGTGDYLRDFDLRPSETVALGKETSQDDVQRFERRLQQVNNSTERGVDMDAFVTGLESHKAQSHRGESKAQSHRGESSNYLPTSEISQHSNLSFYVQVDNILPNYHLQPSRYGLNSYWSPPTIMAGVTTGGSNLFRWLDGNMTAITPDDRVRQNAHHVYSAATIFTQNPDTPHLLVIPFDARLQNAFQNYGGWRPPTFRHARIANTPYVYSFITCNGDREHIAAPGSPHWMPQLLPFVYNHQSGSSRLQAGLIGSLPLLIALAAFSAPPTALMGVLTNCLEKGKWRPHQFQYPSGHIAERGMVVTIFFDPSNPQGSNQDMLDRLERGEFGPFFS